MNEFERVRPSFEGGHEETDEEAFQSYVEDLRLSPEDFDKRILDIGAGSAQFAKWAKEHGVSSGITSLEIRLGVLEEKTRGVVGSGEQLPFADGSFDMVVSRYSMPHSTPWNGYERKDPNILKQKVNNILSEMLRVVGEGGEIRLVGVPTEDSDLSSREMKQFIVEELENLNKEPGISVEKIPIGGNHRHSYYLIVIKKSAENRAKV